jgi:myo-inositol-1-phosphate synthase
MIDAIRCAKIALDRKMSGPIIGPSSYFFKSPPQQFRDDVCREKVEAFIEGNGKE